MNKQDIGIVFTAIDKNVAEVTDKLTANVGKLYGGFKKTEDAKKSLEKNVLGATPIFDQFGNVIEKTEKNVGKLEKGMEEVAWGVSKIPDPFKKELMGMLPVVDEFHTMTSGIVEETNRFAREVKTDVPEGLDKTGKQMKELKDEIDDTAKKSERFRTILLGIATIRLGDIGRNIRQIKDRILGIEFGLFRAGIELEKTKESFVALANLSRKQVGMVNRDVISMGMRWAIMPKEVMEKWQDLIWYVGDQTREELNRSLGLMRLFGLTAEQIGSFEAFGKRVGMTRRQMGRLYTVAIKTQQALQLPPEFIDQAFEMAKGLEEFGFALHFTAAEYELYSKRMIELGGKLRESFGKYAETYMEAISGMAEKTFGWQKAFRKFAVGMSRDMPIEAVETLSIGLGDWGLAMRILYERDTKKQLEMLIEHRKAIEGNAVAVDRFIFAMEDMFGPDIAKIMANVDENFRSFEEIVRKAGEGTLDAGSASQEAQKIMRKMPITVAETAAKIEDEAISWRMARENVDAYVWGLKKSTKAREDVYNWADKLTRKIKEMTGIDLAGWLGKGLLGFQGLSTSMEPLWTQLFNLGDKIIDIVIAFKLFGGSLLKIGKLTALPVVGLRNFVKACSNITLVGSKATGTIAGLTDSAGNLVQPGLKATGVLSKLATGLNIVAGIGAAAFVGWNIGRLAGELLGLDRKLQGILDKLYKISETEKALGKATEALQKAKEGITLTPEEKKATIMYEVGLAKETWKTTKDVGDWMKKMYKVYGIAPGEIIEAFKEKRIQPARELLEAQKSVEAAIEAGTIKTAQQLAETRKIREAAAKQEQQLKAIKESVEEQRKLQERMETEQIFAELYEKTDRTYKEWVKVMEKRGFEERMLWKLAGKEIQAKWPKAKAPEGYVEVKRESPLTITSEMPGGAVQKLQLSESVLGSSGQIDILNEILVNVQSQTAKLQEIAAGMNQPVVIELDGRKVSSALNQRMLKGVALGGVR